MTVNIVEHNMAFNISKVENAKNVCNFPEMMSLSTHILDLGKQFECLISLK